jgi:hypothetical protein
MKTFVQLRKTLMLVALWCGLGTVSYVAAQDFEHPGIFNKECDYARMRQKVAEKAEPWYTTWTHLLASPEAQLSWSPRATATVIRGGTGDNISLMYRDVAAAYQHALIYKISGDKAHGDKAAQILNAWASTNTLLSGNADRYLAAGLDGYQFANAAEMMRGYPGFDIEKFKKYILNVFFYPMNERFLVGNAWGAPHNDACATNYRVNWDACNLNAMLAISILCDNKNGFDEAINYCKSGDGTGNITRAVPYLHPDYPTTGANIVGQWEESGRDQGHATGGMSLYGLFCEIAWNQGVDIYSYDNSRFRKGAEYVARYNIGDSIAGQWKYEDLPFTTYSRLMGSTCTWYTESALGAATRGKLGAGWEMIYNHYARRLNQANKVKGLGEMLQQQQWWSRSWPTLAVHADTYDTPGGGGLTFAADSGSYILPWSNMDIMPRSIDKLPNYGSTTLKDGVLTVKGAGDGITGTLDHCQYAYQRVVDDGSIITRIDSMTEVNNSCQAGVMLRESLEQNAANVFLGLSSVKGLVLSARDSTGKATTIIASDNSVKTFPYWLKLTRSGNIVTASSSSDGVNWVDLGTKTTKLNRSVYLGVATSSANKSLVCKAVFGNAKVTQGNIRPVVNIVTPVKGQTPYVAPANVNITGNAYDIDGTLNRVDVYINDSLSFTSKVSPFTFNLTANNTGNFRLVAKAYDNTGAVQVSDTVTYIVNPISIKLPYYKFNETSTGYFTVDASGNSMTGILYNGPTFAAGKVNNAVSLDGVDDYVKLPSGFIEKLSSFTIATWVKLNAQTSWARIFDFGSGTNAYMYLSPYSGSGLMNFAIKSTDGRTQSVDASTALPAGSWHHVAVTLGSNKLTIYLDGNAVGVSYPFTLRPYDIGSTTANYLGKSQYSSDTYLNGLLDDMRFYNYAMSVTDVKNLISTTLGVNDVGVEQASFYPNPAKDQITVVNAGDAKVSIFNSVGSLVLEKEVTSPRQSVDISTLTSGTYLLIIADSSGNTTRKVLMVK